MRVESGDDLAGQTVVGGRPCTGHPSPSVAERRDVSRSDGKDSESTEQSAWVDGEWVADWRCPGVVVDRSAGQLATTHRDVFNAVKMTK